MADSPGIPRPTTGTRPTVGTGPTSGARAALESEPSRPSSNPGDPRLQALSRTFLGSLFMLVRSAKLYDPENAVFQKPLNALLETVNQIILKDGKLDLAVVQGSFYVNGQLVKVDQASLENMRFLAGEMERRKVGGFGLTKQATMQELKNFVWLFAKDQSDEVGEDGLEGRKLVSMKLKRWTQLKEKLSAQQDAGAVDRKKYAMTLYARLVVFMEVYLGALREGQPAPPTGRLSRLMQDVVDISTDRQAQFLGMTSTGEGEKALTHHLVNTALIAVAFGGELGLTRQRKRDLGLAALMSGVPLLKMPAEQRLVLEPERLSGPLQNQLRHVRRSGASQTLADLGPTRLGFMAALATAHQGQPFGKAMRDARGRITLVVPEGDPTFFGRVINLCAYYDRLTSTTPDHEAYGPEVAFDLLWNQQRWRFDPELLAVFLKVMARQPFKILGKKQGGVVDLVGI